MRKAALLLTIAWLAWAGFSEDMAKLVDSRLKPDQPGGCVLVAKENRIVFLRCEGVADIKTGERITPLTIFNLGSISKTFVAYGILYLVKEGRLSLDDSLLKFFPDFENRTIAEKIKIKHLLSHTSGLPDVRKVEERRAFYLTAKDKENFEPEKHVKKLLFEPGERFHYSNPAFNGLALIIEKVTGRKWQDFIKEKIFRPAGMGCSTITDGPHPSEGVAHAYRLANGRFEEYDYGEFPTFAAAGNGGVWSCILDLFRYEMAIEKHKFLDKKYIELSRTPFHPPNWKEKRHPFVGFSWFIGEEALFGSREFGLKLIYHTGSQGGFRAFHIKIPEKRILLAGVFNRPIKDLKGFIKSALQLLQSYHWLD